MLVPPSYLNWARQLYGQVRIDLATSGVLSVDATELQAMDEGPPPRPDDPDASRRFRAAIARRYAVPEGDVVPSLGASGGIWLSFAATTSPGDEVLVETPAYEPLHLVAEGLGARVRRFQRSVDDSFALSIEAIVRELRPATRVVALSNPHNPSGMFTDDDTMADLARQLRARDVTLIVDEVYREFVAPRTSVHRIAPAVCAISSLTKCFGLGWARAGWVLLPSALSTRAFDAVTHVAGWLPPSSAAFGALGLGHADALFARGTSQHQQKRDLVTTFASKHRGTLASAMPPGLLPFGFFVDRRGGDLRPRIEAGTSSERVIVAPGCFFGYPSGFRLSFAAKAQTVAEGLPALERVLGLSQAPHA